MTAFLTTMPMFIGFTLFLSSGFGFRMIVTMLIAVRVFIFITMPVFATFSMVVLMLIAVRMFVFVRVSVTLSVHSFIFAKRKMIGTVTNRESCE
jgi:hypothetical protein